MGLTGTIRGQMGVGLHVAIATLAPVTFSPAAQSRSACSEAGIRERDVNQNRFKVGGHTKTEWSALQVDDSELEPLA